MKCTYRRQVICWESLDALRIPKSNLLHEIGIRTWIWMVHEEWNVRKLVGSSIHPCSFTMLTSIHHWSLPWVRSIRSIPFHPISVWINMILPSMLSSYKWSHVHISLLSLPCHIPHRSHTPWFYYCNYVRWGLQITM